MTGGGRVMKGRMGSSITPEISQAEVRTGFMFKCLFRSFPKLKRNIIAFHLLKCRINF